MWHQNCQKNDSLFIGSTDTTKLFWFHREKDYVQPSNKKKEYLFNVTSVPQKNSAIIKSMAMHLWFLRLHTLYKHVAHN